MNLPALNTAEVIGKLMAELLASHDFGTIMIQRFDDSDVRRVHVMSSNVCNKKKANEHGVPYVDPFVDVLTDEEIPAAIELGWKKLQLLWHYGATCRMNAWGLVFTDPVPEHLSGVTTDSLNIFADRLGQRPE